MSRLLRTATTRSPIYTFYSSNANVDHYAVLGLKPEATAKDIKSAYYKLSKLHHPDTNRTADQDSTKKFHEVAKAYEVLGSEDQRKVYDMTRIRRTVDTGAFHQRRSQQNRKEYTDIDIDYKTFEQFQQSTRRRRQFHSHFEMPKEFYTEFGGRERVYRSEFEEKTAKESSMYKDSRARRREQEELEREIEREKERLQSKYPMPTFEKMIQEKRAKEQAEQRKYLLGLLGFSFGGMFLFMLIRN
ncbi:unnamed protein product [Auanema sp. JU1783]|nr:unnamed protein product [Auanema sp. JU1783]